MRDADVEGAAAGLAAAGMAGGNGARTGAVEGAATVSDDLTSASIPSSIASRDFVTVGAGAAAADDDCCGAAATAAARLGVGAAAPRPGMLGSVEGTNGLGMAG